MKPPMLIRGMHGLGDNLYQRAVVREISGREVYLHTPWPQLYRDLPIYCLPPKTKLRTQLRNVHRWDQWSRTPSAAKSVQIHYMHKPGSMLQALGACLGVSAKRFDAPAFPKPQRAPEGPYVVVRPATVRQEWRADNRNPKPEYLDRAAMTAAEAGYTVVSVADLSVGHEWLAGAAPYADVRWHAGELSLEELFGLVAHANGAVGGVGWLLPACVAYGVPLLLIYGGQGQHNGPRRILDPVMPTEHIEQAIPDRLCPCSNYRHDCDRTITQLGGHVGRWLVRCDARRAAAVVAGTRHRMVSGECATL